MQEAIFSGKDICNLKAIGRVILSAILLVLTGLMVAFAKAAPDVVFSFYPALSRGILSAISSVSGLVPIALWEVLAAVLVLGAVPARAAEAEALTRGEAAELLLAAGAELALPLLLRLADAPDLPVLTGIFYPFLMLPFFCLCTGWSAGRRFGVALLYPAACGLLTVPCVFLLYNPSALFQVWMAAVPALAGNLLGALVKRRKE